MYFLAHFSSIILYLSILSRCKNVIFIFNRKYLKWCQLKCPTIWAFYQMDQNFRFLINFQSVFLWIQFSKAKRSFLILDITLHRFYVKSISAILDLCRVSNIIGTFKDYISIWANFCHEEFHGFTKIKSQNP